MAVPAWMEAGAGRGPLVFLHGIGGDKESWQDDVAHFAAQGWCAIAWDCPGYGESAPPPEFTWAALSGALLALLDHKRISRAVLVGHSMGGMVAQDFVATHPDRVSALVLSGTSPAFGRPDGEFQRRFVADRLAPLEAGRRMADIAPALVDHMMAPGVSDVVKQAAIRAMAHVPTSTYASAVRNLVVFDRRAALAGIAVPTLCLAGEHDPNAPAAMMEKMAARIPGAAYRCLPGVGHLANLEDSEAFRAALGAFLDPLPNI